MEALRPGHYWKTPFLWEPGCPKPSARSSLRFDAVDAQWLSGAVYIDVLPQFRGRGYAIELLAEATRLVHRGQVLENILRHRHQQSPDGERLSQSRLHGAPCVAAAARVVRPTTRPR
jgi:GNAT superfamily N-acetyltransferase